MPVLFLDFDGVLHREFCHASKHFEFEPSFALAIHRLDVEIVVSSTWRHNREPKELLAQLSDPVSSRIVGMTPRYSQLPDVPSKLALYEREAECTAWLSANRPAYTRWIAVDDRPWLFRPFCPNLFMVDGKRGLDEHSSQLLRARLNELSL
ncbi:HAD domain-containing protein [Acidovorax soli]|uniref:HAD domain-containing protein n=1 Tax=Acidovorax soli TaxID=592050 RepID=UPI0016218368